MATFVCTHGTTGLSTRTIRGLSIPSGCSVPPSTLPNNRRRVWSLISRAGFGIPRPRGPGAAAGPFRRRNGIS